MNFEELLENLNNEVTKIVITNSSEAESFKLEYLVKKGKLGILFDEFKKLDKDQKKLWGSKVNQIRGLAESKFKSFSPQESSQTASAVDLSLEGQKFSQGSRHPISLVMQELVEVFQRLGFAIEEGPEIEDDWHNFSALNFPENHPARDMQDTFFVNKEYALRTHTSSVQVRVMENQKPPIRSIMPGRVYRNEAISARANCFFHQIEGLYIAESVSFQDLKQTLFQFVKDFFGDKTKVRFRASYFPFTEPSAEMDIYLGTETESDYRLTKGTGWLEILGCGMVDEQVLINCGIDPKKYTGYAFGLGIDRIAMLRYGVKDLRTFFQNDIRFLSQFQGE